MFKVLFDPSYRKEPHPYLARMRREDPVHHSDSTGMWFLFRHADCVTAARSPQLGRDLKKWESPSNTWREENAHVNPLAHEFNVSVYNQMFHNNPPDHTRQRRVFQHAFVPAAVRRMEEIVRATATRLANTLPDSEFDLVEHFAAPLPVAVICGLFEVPESDYKLLRGWSDDLAQTVELTITPEQQKAALVAKREFDAYLEELIEARRRNPGDGLIDRVIEAERVEGAMSHSELINNMEAMLFAGHETTANLIANGLWTLLRHPDQLERLRREPELIETAIEEMLRYEPPANTNARVTLGDIRLGERDVPKGSLCILMVAAANRDPEVFDDPEHFDIACNPNPHQTFGGGPHHCIGAALARLEGRIGIQALLTRYPTLELAGDAPWMDRINLRGLQRLPLRGHA